MFRAILVALLAIHLLPQPTLAGDRVSIGWGRLFNNDFLGDGKDRWRSGSYSISKVYGPGWTGELPTGIGQMIELRFRGQTIQPANLSSPDPDDRRYAGTLSFGLHTHFSYEALEISLGGDLVFTGPQTGVGRFHDNAHEFFGTTRLEVLDDQIPNHLYPTALAEVGRTFDVSPTVTFRPFIEAQGGVESLVRIGADWHFGAVGLNDFYMRDVATGHRYRATRGSETGFAAVLGADIAYVDYSAFLPASDGYELTDARYRLRAGVQWQGKRAGIFYGLTYLSEEFEAQPEGQVVGSLRLNYSF
ncbi:lipid A-modifier LpxR family protein [Pseudoruegeria sp. HB172150]|uniref:lipid A-modifier LpxR family protein n=1 Tax=Pseudoruegeria sp. HB172150 TaxID=2721164 RepID=UPI001557C7FE|nr:lipid A-modifier LpxR family protein [Pseudoruegeria sp. HB172150]